MKERNFVSAVVYVYQNQNTIAAFLEQLNTLLEENFQTYEVICVDDASTDGSAAAIRDFIAGTKGAPVSLLDMNYHQGREASLNAGVERAAGDFILEFDRAAMDYQPELILEVYQTALSGFDIVSAAAAGSGRPLRRSSGPAGSPEGEGFRVLSRWAVNRVYTVSMTTSHRQELYANCGLRLSTVQYTPMKGGTRGRARKRTWRACDVPVFLISLVFRLARSLILLVMAIVILLLIYSVISQFTGYWAHA